MIKRFVPDILTLAARQPVSEEGDHVGGGEPRAVSIGLWMFREIPRKVEGVILPRHVALPNFTKCGLSS